MSELDAIVAAATNRLGDLADATDALAGVRAVASSPDGLVTAVVDGSGALVDLVLADDVSRISARALELVVVETADRAARSAREQRESILESLQISFTGT